jgi:translation initiation factor IF-1
MTCEGVMEILKGNRFRFSLDNGHYKEYLVESRKIAEKILKRSVVNIELGLKTI